MVFIGILIDFIMKITRKYLVEVEIVKTMFESKILSGFNVLKIKN
jgi:hypothetical protein